MRRGLSWQGFKRQTFSRRLVTEMFGFTTKCNGFFP